ncbi:hypothetical protein P5V15_013350 [Pogonomyrmex californicus]
MRVNSKDSFAVLSPLLIFHQSALGVKAPVLVAFIEKNGLKHSELFNWCVNDSWSKTANDKVVVGVIDGHNILVTDFRDGIIKDENSLINSNVFCAISYTNELIFFKQEMNKVYKYTKDGQFKETKKSFAMPCSQMEIIKIALNVVIALSHDNFFIDGEVVKNIIDFYVHSYFLLLTTLQATLIYVPLNKTGISVSDLTKLERDSPIITAIPQNSLTVLQMPRGNLECIQPKILLLHILKFYLNSCDYLPAFELMMKQRINLNFYI